MSSATHFSRLIREDCPQIILGEYKGLLASIKEGGMFFTQSRTLAFAPRAVPDSYTAL
jgi:hypothetical protein